MLKKLQHVAIIMDGNGRWAQMRNRDRTFGHIKGARVAKKIITHAADLGLKNLTMYAFSSENWLRPELEVSFLMRLLSRYYRKNRKIFTKKISVLMSSAKSANCRLKFKRLSVKQKR